MDHGIGMSPEQVQRVFDRFWRADPSRKRTTGGSGLGLAIATEDTRLHGGRLEAWGELGEGSTFMVTLPRAPRPAAQGAEAPEPIGRSVLPIPPRYSTADRRYADDLSRPVPQEADADADAVGRVADVAATAADAPPSARQAEQALTAPTRPVCVAPPGDPADGPAAGDRTGEDAAEEAR